MLAAGRRGYTVVEIFMHQDAKFEFYVLTIDSEPLTCHMPHRPLVCHGPLTR